MNLTNLAWSRACAEIFYKLGVRHACISPGSRNSTLAIGFSEYPGMECFSCIDERSGAFFALGIALYVSIPYTAYQVSVSPAVLWLIYFYAVTMIIFTMYGGGFATIPAYLADMFGTKYVGGIHGRLLTAWSTAGVLGPLAITSLRESSVNSAINELVTLIDPAAFRAAFGTGVDQLDVLVTQNSVTIARLMEIAPSGTIDPTSSIYNSTMILMAVLLGIALVSNALMRPVDPKHHLAETPV